MSESDPQAAAPDAAYARRRRHVIWYGRAFLGVLLVVALIQLVRSIG